LPINPEAIITISFFSPVNVRLFNIEGIDDESEPLMDTMGLAAFDLPDLQYHFKDLDPDAVARILHVYGDYIFKNGDIIEGDHTIREISPDDKWVCRHEISLVEPNRILLDINPGRKFAGGSRK